MRPRFISAENVYFKMLDAKPRLDFNEAALHQRGKRTWKASATYGVTELQ